MTSPLATHVLSNAVQRLQIMTARSGSAHGSGRSSTAFTTLKIAAFAPMPSASVSTATAAKPGWRAERARAEAEILPESLEK